MRQSYKYNLIFSFLNIKIHLKSMYRMNNTDYGQNKPTCNETYYPMHIDHSMKE